MKREFMVGALIAAGHSYEELAVLSDKRIRTLYRQLEDDAQRNKADLESRHDQD